MAESDRDSALEPFDALIGIWDPEATHLAVDTVVPVTTTFEWFEGGHFIVQRPCNDHACSLTRSASSALPGDLPPARLRFQNRVPAPGD
jgi:hypothetical protein